MTSQEVNAFMNAGLSFIPVGNDKRPWLTSWEEYQYRRPEPDEIQDMNFRDAPGVAIIAGEVSGGIECIDFDTKNDPKGTIWNEFKEAIKNSDLVDLVKKTTVQTTQSGGYHVIYRCPKPDRSQKLALHDSGKPIIETRGTGGYFVSYPTTRYNLLSGDITNIVQISQEDRDRLINVCKSLSRKKTINTTQTKTHAPHKKELTQIKKTLDKICSQLEATKIDLTVNYDEWVRIGHGLAYTLGEEGRHYYHRIGMYHPQYSVDQSNIKYNDLLKVKNKNKYATVKSVFAIARDHGLDIKDDEFDYVEDWIRKQDFSYNEISRKTEDRFGKEIDDLSLNMYYRRCRKETKQKFSLSEFTTYLYNPDNVRSYNPVLDFFEALRIRDYKGTPTADYIDHLKVKDARWKPLIRKWMLSVVAQAYGYTSEIVLVLVGDQYIGKTEFFVRMFPKDFADDFCSVDRLKEGKDSVIKMTQKLVIVDDEFGGLSRQDAEHFKSLVSQKHFTVRMPYGRTMMDLRRLCVFAGSSNYKSVINDYTGNRRILPIEVLHRDFEKADAVDKLDMWAELVQEYWNIEQVDEWMVTKEDIDFIKAESEAYQHENPARDYITRLFSPGEDSTGQFMTATEICDIINEKYPNARLYPNRIGQELGQLGFERMQESRGGKFRIWGYRVVDHNGEKKEELPF